MTTKQHIFNPGALFYVLFPYESTPQISSSNAELRMPYQEFLALTSYKTYTTIDVGIVNKNLEGFVWSMPKSSSINQNKASHCIQESLDIKIPKVIIEFFDSYLVDKWNEKKHLIIELMNADETVTLDQVKRFAEYTSPKDFAYSLAIALSVCKNYMEFSDDISWEQSKEEVKKRVDCFLLRIKQKESDPTRLQGDEDLIITSARILASTQFSSLTDRGRLHDYLKTKCNSITIKNKFLVEKDSTPLELKDIVFPNDNVDSVCSVSLYSVGGSGKTHQLIALYDLIINSDSLYISVVPFYLELNSIEQQQGNCVISSLAASLEISIHELKNILKTGKHQVILLLDGFNEVTNGDLRQAIARAICDIRSKYGTRIILTSRLDHSDLFNTMNRGLSSSFVKVAVMELDDTQINEYFAKSGLTIRCGDIYKSSPISKRLLSTVQGLVMYTDLLIENPKARFYSLGELLRAYSKKILLVEDSGLYFEVSLRKLAWLMVSINKFKIEKSVVDMTLGSEFLNELLNSEGASNIFMSTADDQNIFNFSHQHFRDMYCALQLAEHLKDLSNFIPQVNNKDFVDNFASHFQAGPITGDSGIRALCADFLSLEQIQHSIDILKEIHDIDYQFILSMLIEIYAIKNNYNISTLSLSTLDLTNVSLSGYKLYQKSDEQKIFIDLADSIVSHDTFLQNGLQRGSSTICKYTINGRDYILAFSSRNALEYDVETNNWKCLRNWPDLGWISCCCETVIDGKTAFLLGCETNHVRIFYPENRFNDTEEMLLASHNTNCNTVKLITGHVVQLVPYNIDCKRGGIESIVKVFDINDNPLHIASNGFGDIFLLYTDEKLHCFPDSIVEDIREDTKKFSKVKSPCRITVSENNRIFFCFGKYVYSKKLPFDKKSVFEPWLTLDSSALDIIHSGKYIFVNQGNKVSIFNNDGEQVTTYIPEKQEQLDHFTKFSPSNRPEKVLIGVFPKDPEHNTLPNFYEISIIEMDDEDGDCIIACIGNPLMGLQTKATYTGIYFESKYWDTPRIATTSDDRSIQILAPEEEDAAIMRHEGSYDGVRYVEPISENEFLAAQYDGSISHWKFKNGLWRCLNVFPIHQNWVWKVLYHSENEESCFYSCSYDNTVKRTNMKTGESVTILLTDRPVLDLVLGKDRNGKLKNVIAISSEKLLWYNVGTGVGNALDIATSIHDYIRAIAINNEDTPYIAINYSCGDDKHCHIVSISNHNCQKVSAIDVSEFSFIRGLRFLQLEDDEVLEISGSLKTMNRGMRFYSFNKGKMIDEELLKTLSFGDSPQKGTALHCVQTGNRCFLAFLDGTIQTFTISDNFKLDTIQTHARLISWYGIKLSKIKWNSETQRAEFQKDFKGYFQC